MSNKTLLLSRAVDKIMEIAEEEENVAIGILETINSNENITANNRFSKNITTRPQNTSSQNIVCLDLKDIYNNKSFSYSQNSNYANISGTGKYFLADDLPKDLITSYV